MIYYIHNGLPMYVQKKCAFKKEIKRKENLFRCFLKIVYNNWADKGFNHLLQ